jgi:hypothetical protein
MRRSQEDQEEGATFEAAEVAVGGRLEESLPTCRRRERMSARVGKYREWGRICRSCRDWKRGLDDVPSPSPPAEEEGR